MPELPDDVKQLKTLLQQVYQENAVLKSQVQLLTEQLKLSTSKRFSSQSEKRDKGTFNEAEQQSALDKPKHHKKGRKPLPKELERELRSHTLSEPQCDCCGHTLHTCGEEVSEELKVRPQKVTVIRHLRTKYACRQCENTGMHSRIITAPKPANLLPKSIASAETQAAIVTAKYADALPLYCQVDILKRAGIEISRTTLANWCMQLGDKVAVIIKAMQAQLLSESLICADETTVQVLIEPNKAAQSKSYMWVYRSGEFHPNPVVIYDYQPSRASSCVEGFLGDYSGYLLSDGYVAYNQLERVTQAGCMAHVRRKFTDAQKAQPSKKTGRIETALNYIGKLYGVEQRAKTLNSLERQALRQQQSKAVMDEFYHWLTEAREKVLPKSALGKAINYSLNQWPKLTSYLEDGDISIDNNVTERDIRPFTTGRKNWMFSTSVDGAKASANLYSLVMTCRANDINPYYYFEHLFKILPLRQEGEDITDLLPWNVNINEAT